MSDERRLRPAPWTGTFALSSLYSLPTSFSSHYQYNSLSYTSAGVGVLVVSKHFLTFHYFTSQSGCCADSSACHPNFLVSVPAALTSSHHTQLTSALSLPLDLN
ncbi:hypothetical protein ONS95_014602 [Cadophora gregata]|uniref:uncharacterized protein n=1 Tax=Cadophora gregata TaxID=51156 RepID=UPI0026DD93E1|nr:uncharacterized protein ONS95_014602 [Cadophora gregata]KAK0112880.1 hypothetical protein ONS95_014602 [Cadophora gregata]